MEVPNAKDKFDALFEGDADDQLKIVDESSKSLANPDAMLIDAVLLFYRELGLRPSTISHIAERSMRRHKNAMRVAIAHVMRRHFDERELQVILGAVTLSSS